MEIISIEKKTFEELVSRLGQFVKRMDSINRKRSSRRMSDWMDNQDVCQALKISPRTLQTLRDSGRLSHSKINNRIYYRNNSILPYRQLGGKILYRESDIERVLQSCYRGKF